MAGALPDIFTNLEWHTLMVKNSYHKARKTSLAHVLAVSLSRKNQHEQFGVYASKHLLKHLYVISVYHVFPSVHTNLPHSL